MIVHQAGWEEVEPGLCDNCGMVPKAHLSREIELMGSGQGLIHSLA